MKKYIYLICFMLLNIVGVEQSHANVDYVRTNVITYSCDTTNGIGTLRIEFGGGGGTVLHHRDIRYYHINHAGWVTINNNNPLLATGNIPPGSYYIPGCTMLNACTTTSELTGPTNYTAVAGNQLKYRYGTAMLDACSQNYTYPGNFADNTYNVGITGNSLNYWPINSGPSNRDWSWGIVKSVTIKSTERDSRRRWYCDTNMGTATARYATTIVTLIPGANGGLPDTQSAAFFNHLNRDRALVAINTYEVGLQFGDIFANKPAAVQFTTLRDTLVATPSICQVRTSCDVSVSNNALRTTALTETGTRCSEGTPGNFVAMTDTAGKTTYTWSCTKANAAPTSCTAYYKPLETPTSTDGACEERYSINDPRNPQGHPPRLPDQCQYSVISNQSSIGMTGGIIATQDGPVVVGLTGSYLRSTNGVIGNCQAPIDGKPRIVCSADSLINISGTLSSFTLPSSITQRIGGCSVIFDAPDVCRPRTDTISTRAVVVDCDPAITDHNNPRYCPTSVGPVCVQLNDKFGNPVLGYSTGRIVSRFSGATLINRYFELHNPGLTDTTRYDEGSYREVEGSYCTPRVCTVVNGALCGIGCPGQGSLTCDPLPPLPCDPDITDPNDTRYCRTVCVNTIEEPTKCPSTISIGDPFCDMNPRDPQCCIPTEINNYCKPPVPTTEPGCDSPDYVGDPLLCIDRPKACTAHLEVLDSFGNWTTEGDAIIYDEAMTYRIVVDGTDAVCRNGIISFTSPNPITATGGTFSGNLITWSSTGAFTATVIRDGSSTPKTARGPQVRAVYTQPGGISYGLTARTDDFEDTPLTIAGDRMKGVRIIGAAGSNITSFNLNNAGVIGEDSSASTVTMRNAVLRNVGLLTRGITYTDLNNARVVNNVFYVEGDFEYNTLRNAIGGSSFRTIIVRGNLTIDTSFPRHDSTDPIIGFIVVKDRSGNKGDIIIKNDVTSMRGILFVEGSFYGETQTFGNVPLNKLVLKGSLFSRNTVGGSAEENNLYISGGATTTDFAAAFLQDLNNVRNGYGCPTGADTACYKNYPDPFIIDYENTLSDPPPGFSL